MRECRHSLELAGWLAGRPWLAHPVWLAGAVGRTVYACRNSAAGGCDVTTRAAAISVFVGWWPIHGFACRGYIGNLAGWLARQL